MMACNVSFAWNTVKSILVAISLCNCISIFPLSFIHGFVSSSTFKSYFLHSSVFFGVSIRFFFFALFGRYVFSSINTAFSSSEEERMQLIVSNDAMVI